MSQLFFILVFFISLGCGIKGKPLPPAKVTTQEVDSENQKEKKK